MLIPRQTTDGTQQCPECGVMAPWRRGKLYCGWCLSVHEVDTSVSSTVGVQALRKLEMKLVLGNA